MKKVLLTVSALGMVLSFAPGIALARTQATNSDYRIVVYSDQGVLSTTCYKASGNGYIITEYAGDVPCSGNVPNKGTTKTYTITKISKGLALGLKNDNQVGFLQIFLKNHGYLKTDPTANYGQMTVAAVRVYQKAKGLPVTGSIGPRTRAAIATDMASGSADTSTGTSAGGTSAGKVPPTVQVVH